MIHQGIGQSRTDRAVITRRKRSVLKTALLGALVVVPGCGIPCLRCAQPGPTLPSDYRDATNWPIDDEPGVGGSPWADSTQTSENDESVEESDQDDALQFASFIESASHEDFSESGDSSVQPAAAEPEAERTDESSITVAGLIAADGEIAESEVVDPVKAFTFNQTSFNSLDSSGRLCWYEFFDDPILAGLIQQALSGNQELKMLAEEIRIARYEVQARSGEYRPFVTLGAGAGVEKPGRFTRDGAVEEQLEVKPGEDFPDPLPDFLVAANVTWELDIWKRLRNAQNAAAYRYLATREGRNYVITRLIAEVAQTYHELLALDNRLDILNATIEIQQQSLGIAEAKKQAGRGTELAVQRFQAEVRKNESERLIVQQQIVEAENRINFLLGRYPQPIERPSVDYVDLNLNTLRAGVPAQLLQNRPDIRQAEKELAAAGLEVKVARARFYPSLALTAGVGWQAFDPRYLFWTPESLLYNAAGELVGPLINKRAIRADYMAANAEQLRALYNYQRTILNAYTEVINRLAAVENYAQSIEIKKQQLDSLVASVDSATKLFQNARAEYMEVLLAQRDMMEAKMVLVETKQQQLSAVVNAYQALGGGF